MGSEMCIRDSFWAAWSGASSPPAGRGSGSDTEPCCPKKSRARAAESKEVWWRREVDSFGWRVDDEGDRDPWGDVEEEEEEGGGGGEHGEEEERPPAKMDLPASPEALVMPSEGTAAEPPLPPCCAFKTAPAPWAWAELWALEQLGRLTARGGRSPLGASPDTPGVFSRPRLGEGTRLEGAERIVKGVSPAVSTLRR